MFLMNAGIYTTASPLQRNGLFPSRHSSSIIQLCLGDKQPQEQELRGQVPTSSLPDLEKHRNQESHSAATEIKTQSTCPRKHLAMAK